MIEADYRLKIDCDFCDEKMSDSAQCNIFCEKCFESMHDLFVKNFISKMSLDKYVYEDKDSYAFDSEYDRDLFMRGVKYGLHHCLFWLADRIDSIKWFEENIQEIFYKKK